MRISNKEIAKALKVKTNIFCYDISWSRVSYVLNMMFIVINVVKVFNL
jgi:hypothetical protein